MRAVHTSSALSAKLQIERSCSITLPFEQAVEVDDRSPVGLVEQHDRQTRRLAGLAQGQELEQLVERAEAAGKTTRALARIAKCILRMAK